MIINDKCTQYLESGGLVYSIALLYEDPNSRLQYVTGYHSRL